MGFTARNHSARAWVFCLPDMWEPFVRADVFVVLRSRTELLRQCRRNSWLRPPISTECREIFAGGSGLGSLPWIPRSARPSFPRRSRAARGIKRSPGFAVDKKCGGEGTTAVTIDSNTYGRLEHEDGSWGFVGCSGSCSLRRWDQKLAGYRGIPHRRSWAAMDPPPPVVGVPRRPNYG